MKIFFGFFFKTLNLLFRFLNPYNIQEPVISFFKVNIHHLYATIIRNRKIKINDYLLNYIFSIYPCKGPLAPIP